MENWNDKYILLIKDKNIASRFYLGVSRILQYFRNIRHNSAAPNAFAEVLKVMKHSGLWDAENATHQSTSSKTTVWALPDLAWSLRFLQPDRNLLNQLVTVLFTSLFRITAETKFELVKHIRLRLMFLCGE